MGGWKGFWLVRKGFGVGVLQGIEQCSLSLGFNG